MQRNHRALLVSTLAVAAIVVMPLLAQKAPYSEATPTKDAPLRFTAFAVQMQGGGRAGEVEIAIERWSTDEERQALVTLVKATTDREKDQEKLVKALQDIEPRVGFIRTANSMGWDLKYAYETQLEDGSRQIVIATDKPVSFLAAFAGSRSMDYAFTLVEMRFPAGTSKGEGKLLAQSSIAVKDGKLQIELYGSEPTRLTTITEKNPKQKK